MMCRWLGQNSKQGKLARQLGDVQIRMRLKVSGDKSEIRQSYIPALFPHIVLPLQEEGAVRPVGCFAHVVDFCLALMRCCISCVSEHRP